MKIKKTGFTSFLLTSGTTNTSVVTDPLYSVKSKAGFTKTKADICIFTDPSLISEEKIIESKKLDTKVVPDNRDKIIEISSPGEFEIGGLMIRRGLKEPFYLIDEKELRVVYLGLVDKDFDVDLTKDLGDVEVLIAPVGDGEKFPSYEKLEKIINNIDPNILLPYGFSTGENKTEGLKTRDEFIKYFGFTNVSDENYINIKGKTETEQKFIKVIFLKD
jgi:hypothetical protein